MSPNIETVRSNTDAIQEVEAALGGRFNDLTFAAEYGYGSLTKAAEYVHESRQHADRAVVAAAVGNAIMAAKHEAQAATADADAGHMLRRAQDHLDDLRSGLTDATKQVDDATSLATSLVGIDDSSPAAEIHTKVAAQPDAVDSMAHRLEEAEARVSGSRDPGELRAAAEHLLALRGELEEASGRAQEIASDAHGYSSVV